MMVGSDVTSKSIVLNPLYPKLIRPRLCQFVVRRNLDHMDRCDGVRVNLHLIFTSFSNSYCSCWILVATYIGFELPFETFRYGVPISVIVNRHSTRWICVHYGISIWKKERYSFVYVKCHCLKLWIFILVDASTIALALNKLYSLFSYHKAYIRQLCIAMSFLLKYVLQHWDRSGQWPCNGKIEELGTLIHTKMLCNNSLLFQCKIEKVPRGIRGEKSSKDMASSRNLVSTIGALASPKMGDGTRCPEG